MPATKEKDVTKSTGSIDDGRATYLHYSSRDGRLHCYLAKIDGTLVISNSIGQLAKLSTFRKPLSKEPEYKYFRHRYQLDHDNRNKGLLVISDATIRRWCGPRWRIACARRRYAHSALATLKASEFGKRIANLPDQDPTVATDRYHSLLGKVEIQGNRIKSEKYGWIDTMSPIIDLPITHVTDLEKKGYEAWRNRYERLWRRSFDPIAIQFEADTNKLDLDLMVLPLIAGSQYQFMRSFSALSTLNPEGIDLHPESLVHAAISLNSMAFDFALSALDTELTEQLGMDPRKLLGESVSIYIDQDEEYWNNLESDDLNDFMQTRNPPIGITFEIREMKFSMPFLIAVRKFLDQNTAGKNRWSRSNMETTNFSKLSLTRVILPTSSTTDS